METRPLMMCSTYSKLGVFTNLQLLKTWCEATPEMIFPHRKIGHFKEGYEASFLVLTGNPLEDFTQVKSIRLRFKQGDPIPIIQQKGPETFKYVGTQLQCQEGRST